jgi:excisionase family DNA binding protein
LQQQHLFVANLLLPKIFSAEFFGICLDRRQDFVALWLPLFWLRYVLVVTRALCLPFFDANHLRPIMSATIPKPGATPVLLDVRAVAELLGCSDRHVYRLADSGRMPKPRKLGALCRWSRTEIDHWIADGCPIVQQKTPRNLAERRQ